MAAFLRTAGRDDVRSRRSSITASLLLWFAYDANLWGTHVPAEVLEALEIDARLERVAKEERRLRRAAC